VEFDPLLAVAILLVVAYVFFYLPAGQIRKLLIPVILAIIGYALIVAVAEMPPFGAVENPQYNHVAQRYIEEVVQETGAVNAIAAVLCDYRALDTLGEATVLFVAIAAAVATLKAT